jgi:addiction module HigA family antidote
LVDQDLFAEWHAAGDAVYRTARRKNEFLNFGPPRHFQGYDKVPSSVENPAWAERLPEGDIELASWRSATNQSGHDHTVRHRLHYPMSCCGMGVVLSSGLRRAPEQQLMSVKQLAKSLAVDAARLNEIVRGRRGITADTALRLARYLGTTPEFWLKLQVHYELRVARQTKLKDIEHTVRPRSEAA